MNDKIGMGRGANVEKRHTIAPYHAGFVAIMRSKAPRPNNWNAKSTVVNTAKGSAALRLKC